jgi:hypothetical protein
MLRSLVVALLGMASVANTCLAQFGFGPSTDQSPAPYAHPPRWTAEDNARMQRSLVRIQRAHQQPSDAALIENPIPSASDDSLASFADKSWAVKPAHEIAAEREILTALERKVTVQFKETPLMEVVAQFRQHLQINVRMDEAKLLDEGVQSEQPVTLEFTNVSTASALSHLLRPLQLAWIIRGEALIITTESDASDRLETRVFPVRDLVTVRDSTGTWEDYQSLIDAITSTIIPDGWDMVGGEGNVSEFDPSGVLLIRQTQPAHREITLLLDQLRKARGLSTVPVRRRFTNSPTAAFFDVPTETRRERIVTDPPTWRVPQAYR